VSLLTGPFTQLCPDWIELVEDFESPQSQRRNCRAGIPACLLSKRQPGAVALQNRCAVR